MGNKRRRQSSPPFVMLYKHITESEQYAALSHKAVKLLIDIYSQYNGTNNGDMTAAFSIMKSRGWRSKDTLLRAKQELLEKGWVIQTRQGGRRICSLYAVTFQPIDDCNGKIDRAASRTALGYWKLGCNPEINPSAPYTDLCGPTTGSKRTASG